MAHIEKHPMHFDYLIVGAGSAGCVLANRLSNDPNKQVLLIEAGKTDRHLVQRIPAATVWLHLGNKKRDWCYETQPDPSRHDRVEMCSRGKLLGGSSSINGMIYVRGAKEDFDHWADLGNEGWSYQEVLPLFKSLEDHEFSRPGTPHSEYYGSEGPLKIRQMRGAHRLSHAFLSACEDLGIPPNAHYNASKQDGASILSMTQSRHLRYSSSRAFLEPIRHRRNLQILTETLVTEVLLKDKRVAGVRIAGPGGLTSEFSARQVILSAGAINSPQLLLLSGIGPAHHLQDVGLSVHHNLPGVGQNLQDHPLCEMQATVNVPTLSTSVPAAMRAAVDWLLFGKGPLMSAAFQALAFARSDAELKNSGVQIHMMPGGFVKDENNGIQLLESCITLLANVSHPRSRGQLKLASRFPHDPPAIYPNMLSNEEDVKVLRAACRLCRQLLTTKSFRPYVKEETSPGTGVQTDHEWEDFIRKTAATALHQSGTCKMGTDSMAVVDPSLKVHGLEGLRVIDGSIMPTIPSGNTNASCMMIGAKGADLILREAMSIT